MSAAALEEASAATAFTLEVTSASMFDCRVESAAALADASAATAFTLEVDSALILF